MIFNPIVSGGGSEIFTINDTTDSSWPNSARAGEIVSRYLNNMNPVVTSDSGIDIPVKSSSQDPTTRAGFSDWYYFVMPADNVTITRL